MDVTQFRQAVRNLAILAEDLCIQTEFYKGVILETNNVDPENLRSSGAGGSPCKRGPGVRTQSVLANL